MWALALQMEMGPHKDTEKLWPGCLHGSVLLSWLYNLTINTLFQINLTFAISDVVSVLTSFKWEILFFKYFNLMLQLLQLLSRKTVRKKGIKLNLVLGNSARFQIEKKCWYDTNRKSQIIIFNNLAFFNILNCLTFQIYWKRRGTVYNRYKCLISLKINMI